MIPRIEEFGDKHCIIIAKLEGDNRRKISEHAFPGFAKWVDGTRHLRFRPTANNIKYINENWPDAVWTEGAQRHLINFISEQKAASDLAKMKTQILEDDGSYEYKTKPFDHQRHAFLLSRDVDTFALFMEQGTGKTKIAIDKAAYKYSNGDIEALIVLAPNGVHTNWCSEEIPIHLPDWCPREIYHYNAKKVKAKKNKETGKMEYIDPEFERVMASENCLKIFAFNIEGFTSAKAKYFLERVIRTYKIIGVMDESQYCKNHSAVRTKYLTKQFVDVKNKLIMTGTNITKGVEDLYGQLSWLNPNILGFDTFTSFRGHFCAMGGYENRSIIGYKNIDELIQLMDGHSFRVLKKDCLDLPEKLYKRFHVELTHQQLKLYNELRKDYFTQLEGDNDNNFLTADIGVVRLLRLQQISNGWFPADDSDELQRIPGDNPKIEAVQQHCKDTIGSILVWCNGQASTQDIITLEEELKRDHGNDNVGTYYGRTPDDIRAKNVKGFQSKDMKIMICNKAAARGLTLTACENPIYHSNSFDLEVRLQSEDRCHRIGTTGSVTYTDVQANCQTDRQIINSLRSKKIIADLVNRDPDSFFLEEAA